MVKQYKHTDPRVGPGGIRCPCCCPMHKGRSLKATKQYLNRRYRRKAKQTLETEKNHDRLATQ